MLTASGDQTVRLWDVETMVPHRTFRGRHGSVKAVAVQPESGGDVFASCGRDGAIALWDAREGRRRTRSEGHGADGEPASAPAAMLERARTNPRRRWAAGRRGRGDSHPCPGRQNDARRRQTRRRGFDATERAWKRTTGKCHRERLRRALPGGSRGGAAQRHLSRVRARRAGARLRRRGGRGDQTLGRSAALPRRGASPSPWASSWTRMCPWRLGVWG